MAGKMQESAVRAVLAWRGRLTPVRRMFRNRPSSLAAGPVLADMPVRVAAIQVQARLYHDGQSFARDMRRLAARAADAGARLAVFPEDVGSLMIGFIPGIERMVGSGGDGDGLPQGVSITDVFRLLAGASLPVYRATFAGIAREFGICVFAGSMIVPDSDGNVYNRASVFGPDGRELGVQDKVHLFPSPVEDGLQPGTDFTLFDLPFARAATPICMDATYFETFRLLAARGVELVTIPIANPEEYDYWYALRGIWPRIQENHMFGIKSALVGEMLGFGLTGVSGVYAPLELTPKGDGVLAEAGSFDREDVVVADLDFAALRRFARDNPLDWRPEVYRRYLPRLYHAAGGDSTRS